MKFLFKLVVSASLAVILGAGSALLALYFVTASGTASATSENPYSRAAYVLRDFLPQGGETGTSP
ncbi:MAG: hypothetical protein WBG82_15400 [Parvibaculum sp.]|uniref:hypothetical protein n=1 Tax=Parvibaculum sp. TaxID=2024848 RepID=UPI003C74AB6F